MNLNTLYRITFDRDVDDMGRSSYSKVFMKRGSWHVYNILTRSEEYATFIKNLAHERYHVVRCGDFKSSDVVPTVVLYKDENEFMHICKKLSMLRTTVVVVHESRIQREHLAPLVFKQRGKIAGVFSGYPRFETENKATFHDENVIDKYAVYWKAVDVHGTNYTDAKNLEEPTPIDPERYVSLDMRDAPEHDVNTTCHLLSSEPHILPRVKSMYDGVHAVMQNVHDDYDLIIRSRSDVRIFDFIDATDGALWIQNQRIGALTDDVVYIPYASYKKDVYIITDMIAMGSPHVMRVYGDISKYCADGLRIPRVPELLLYQYFHEQGITIVPVHLKYSCLRVIDFGETHHTDVYLGPLYGTCIVEPIGSYVRIRNDNGQRMGHHCGVISFSHTHIEGDDLFVVYKSRLFSTNLDVAYSVVMKANHMMYLTKGDATVFSFDIPKIQRYTFKDPKTDIVIARYNESLEWCTPYAPMCIVYNKGEPLKNNCGLKVRHLPNVGRESHTYLSHIIYNWDTLNEYTVFMQGGDIGHGQEQPHMFEGITVDTYVKAKDNFFMLLSGCQDTSVSMKHWIREGYQGEPEWFGVMMHKSKYMSINHARIDALKQERGFWKNEVDTTPIVITPHGVLTYPDDTGASVVSFHWCPTFASRFATFFVDIFNAPCPRYVYYSQGAQFKVHRDVIKRRPIEFYKKLLTYVEHSTNPHEGYFCELIWWYIFK